MCTCTSLDRYFHQFQSTPACFLYCTPTPPPNNLNSCSYILSTYNSQHDNVRGGYHPQPSRYQQPLTMCALKDVYIIYYFGALYEGV